MQGGILSQIPSTACGTQTHSGIPPRCPQNPEQHWGSFPGDTNPFQAESGFRAGAAFPAWEVIPVPPCLLFPGDFRPNREFLISESIWVSLQVLSKLQACAAKIRDNLDLFQHLPCGSLGSSPPVLELWLPGRVVPHLCPAWLSPDRFPGTSVSARAAKEPPAFQGLSQPSSPAHREFSIKDTSQF